MSGEFDSKKDSHPTKFEQRPRILIELSFRELCDSTLSGLRAFDNMVISLSQKRGENPKSWLWVHETLILEIIFVTLTEDSSAVINDTQGPREYLHHRK